MRKPKHNRVTTIHIEYTVGAHEFCWPIEAKTLRSLAELLEAGKIGKDICDVFVGENVRVVFIGAILPNEERIPH
jgi:hypothetical protein